jgi:hypothetical protein
MLNAEHSSAETIHVIKHGTSWGVVKGGTLEWLRLFPIKENAVSFARGFILKGFDLIVHRSDGTVERYTKALKAA